MYHNTNSDRSHCACIPPPLEYCKNFHIISTLLLHRGEVAGMWERMWDPFDLEDWPPSRPTEDGCLHYIRFICLTHTSFSVKSAYLKSQKAKHREFYFGFNLLAPSRYLPSILPPGESASKATHRHRKNRSRQSGLHK